MYKLQTSFTFEAAHRLYNVDTYSEACKKNQHGHSYVVTVVVRRPHLNSAGMAVDFKLLKEILKSTIEDVYDHSSIMKFDDPLTPVLLGNCEKVIVVDQNPTAEWMAEKFFRLIQKSIDNVDSEVRVCSVAVQETERNIAIYEVDE